MKCNVGKSDKVMRVILGVIIIGLGLYFRSWWGLVGLVPLLTGLVKFCPMYSMLGMSTCKKSQVSKTINN